jgi:hypothetical protein
VPKTVTLIGGPLDGGTLEVPWDAKSEAMDGGIYQPITTLDHLKRVWRWWSAFTE